MKKISFDCKNKDSEIVSIIICILMFIAGWLISSAIARSIGNSFGVTVIIPVLFLICGAVLMSKRKKTNDNKGFAQFSENVKVKITFGGRSVIFSIADIKNIHYTKDTLTNDGYGNTYVLVIRLPYHSYKIYTEAPVGEGFEQTKLYDVYDEIKTRQGDNSVSS